MEALPARSRSRDLELRDRERSGRSRPSTAAERTDRLPSSSPRQRGLRVVLGGRFPLAVGRTPKGPACTAGRDVSWGHSPAGRGKRSRMGECTNSTRFPSEGTSILPHRCRQHPPSHAMRTEGYPCRPVGRCPAGAGPPWIRGTSDTGRRDGRREPFGPPESLALHFFPVEEKARHQPELHLGWGHLPTGREQPTNTPLRRPRDGGRGRRL